MGTERRIDARTWRRPLALSLAVGTALALVACDDPTGIDAPEVTSVAVGPVGRTVVVGDTVRFTATVKGSDGSVIEGLQVQWVTGDEDVATVVAQGGTGLVTAKAAGTVQITARAGGKTGATALSITQQPPVAVTIRITPETPSLHVGDRITLEGSLRTAEDEIVEGAPIAWASSDVTTAVLEPGDAPGRIVVHALKAGIVTIEARSGALENGIQIGISEGAPEIVGVDVTPASATLAPGARTPLRAWLRTAQGELVPDAAIMWSSSDTTVAALELGSAPDRIVVRGVRAGTASIVARYGMHQTSAGIVVEAGTAVGHMEMRPATLTVETGTVQTLSVHAWGPDGGWLEDASVQWRSLDATVVNVMGTGRSARVAGIRPGTATVEAKAGAVVVTATVTVRSAPHVQQVIVNPSAPTAWAGSLLRLRAHALATGGHVYVGYPVAWSVEDTTIATIEADGLVHARRPGSTRVFARSGGKQGEATLRVYPMPAATMTFDLAPTEGPWGEWRPLVSLGDTVWTSPSGTTHTARQFLIGGHLSLDVTSSTWTQTLRVEVLADLGAGPMRVGVKEWSDQGTLTWGVSQAWQVFLDSSRYAGVRLEGAMPQPGRMALQQAVDGTQVRDYLWILR